MSVQYLANENGHVTAVQITLKEWKVIERKVKAFDIADNIRKGLEEADKIAKGEIKAKNIEELLNEL